VIWVVQFICEKYSAFPVGQIISTSSPVPRSSRGAFRDRHGRRARDAVDAICAFDEWRGRGRRSRVVLTPRRWRSSGDNACALRLRWWQTSPVTKESTKETVKTIARGMPGDFRRDRGDYARVLPTHCTRGRGRIGRPAFPAPSDWRGRKIYAGLGFEGAAGRWRHAYRVPDAVQHRLVMHRRAGTHLASGTNRSRFCEAALHAASRPGHEEGACCLVWLFEN
jgi:hypothetical protein